MRTKRSVSTCNIYRVGHTNVEQSLTIIMLTKKRQISHRVCVYYMIKLFDIFRSVFCVFYGILDTRNLYLSLQDLLGPLKLIIESDISCSTCNYTLSMWMLHIHIHKLTLTQKTSRKNILKVQKPCGGFPYLFQGCFNLSKRISQVRTFFLMLS